MSTPSDTTKSLLIILSVFTLVIVSTYFISLFARGYRYDFKTGTGLTATGLLSATSKPKSASVYVDGRLVTATDDTINLPPGEYDLKIVKDGYLPWQKHVVIKKEIVYQTEAQLFRSVPDLKPLTLSGAINPAANIDNTRIIYAVASASATRDNGLYVIDLSDNPLALNRAPRQIAPNFPSVDWSRFTYAFSPNSRSVLATNESANISYLINIDAPISQKDLLDATPRLPLISQEWYDQTNQIITSRLELLPKTIQSLVSTDSARDIQVSSTEDKILYLAKFDGLIPDHIIPPPPAQSTQSQARQLIAGNYYVYDIKDDTNFFIGSGLDINHPYWLTNSNSIIYTKGNEIKVVDYDNTNLETIFAGIFNPDVVYPWVDGSRIVTLTSPFQGAPENLYAITIR